jgi:hypothetical protein
MLKKIKLKLMYDKKHIKVEQNWIFIVFFEKIISLESKIKKLTKNQNLCVEN